MTEVEAKSGVSFSSQILNSQIGLTGFLEVSLICRHLSLTRLKPNLAGSKWENEDCSPAVILFSSAVSGTISNTSYFQVIEYLLHHKNLHRTRQSIQWTPGYTFE